MNSVFMKAGRCLRSQWMVCAIFWAAFLCPNTGRTETQLKLSGNVLPPLTGVDFPDGFGDSLEGIPPILLFSNPPNGAADVPANSPIAFSFSKAMGTNQAATWSANLVPSNFNYAWSPDGKVLTCNYQGGWPPNATITWTLDPAIFKDTAGNPLMPFNNSGTFATGSGSSVPPPPGPCADTNTVAGDGGSFGVTKLVSYLQQSDSPPVIDSEAGATFSAMLMSPTNNPAVQATLIMPDGTSLSLTNNPFVPRFFTFFQQFNSQSALDAAFPTGAYRFSVRRQDGTSGAATLSLPGGDNLPAPHIQNYTPTQQLNPAADFTLRWFPFTGAGATEGIFLSMQDDSGRSFQAPDICVPRELKVTDVSIVIPKNTFVGNKIVDGSLTFTKGAPFDTNSIPGLGGFAGYSKSTSFKARTTGSGSPPTEPRFTRITKPAAGPAQLNLTGAAGGVYTIEASTDLLTWSPLTNIVAVSGTIEVFDPQSLSLPYRFYRVKGQPVAPAAVGALGVRQ